MKNFLCLTILAIALSASIDGVVSAEQETKGESTANTPIDIGGRRELFLDDYLVERFTGDARLVLHHPTPREIVITHDEPWEGGTCGYHTVLQDGNLYRMYYRGGWGHKVYCYAESGDGGQCSGTAPGSECRRNREIGERRSRRRGGSGQ